MNLAPNDFIVAAPWQHRLLVAAREAAIVQMSLPSGTNWRRVKREIRKAEQAALRAYDVRHK